MNCRGKHCGGRWRSLECVRLVAALAQKTRDLSRSSSYPADSRQLLKEGGNELPHSKGRERIHNMKMLVATTWMCMATAPVCGAVIGSPSKPYDDQPDDRACEHQELVQEKTHAYQIELRGTVDGVMTRDPVAYGAFRQGWQPNRSLLIENLGQTDVVNPRVIVGGRRNWGTLQDVAREATAGYTSDADRARAVWEFLRRRRFHACTWDNECNDVVKVLNVYGYTLCGNEAHLINDLWKAAGLTPRRGYPVGHVVCEVFYDGDYHLLDSDEHVICLERDNRTIASCAEVVRDHDLIKRTHTPTESDGKRIARPTSSPPRSTVTKASEKATWATTRPTRWA